MKRSEMVNVIADIFMDINKGITFTKEEAANYLLTQLEERTKISPPPYFFNDGDLGSKWIDGWEPEDNG